MTAAGEACGAQGWRTPERLLSNVVHGNLGRKYLGRNVGRVARACRIGALEASQPFDDLSVIVLQEFDRLLSD